MLKKENLAKLHKNRFFIKFILNVLLTSGISVLILTSIIFYWMKGKMMEDLEKINTNELLVIGAAFQGYMEDSRNTAMTLYQNLNVKNVMLSGDTSWNNSYYNAISQVRNVLTVNQMINSIYVINPNGIVFKIANETESPQAQEELFRIITSKDYPVGKPLLWHMPSTDAKKIPAVTVFFRENISSNGTFNGAIAVNLNWENLQKKLFTDHPNSETVIIDSNGSVIAHSAGDSFSPDEALLEALLSSSKSCGTFRFSVNSQDMLISYSSLNDEYKIFSVTDYKNSMQSLTSSRNFLFIICGTILITIFIVSLIIAYLIYLPIDNIFHHIHTLFQKSEENAESGNDLSMITGTLTHIAERMNSLEQKQVENTVINMLTNPSAPSFPENFIISSGILQNEQTDYMLFLIRFHDSHTLFSTHTPESISFIINSICALTTEYLSEHNFLCSAYQTDKDCITLILSGKNDSVNLHSISASETAHNIGILLQDILTLDVSIGISAITDEIDKMNLLYAETHERTNIKVFHPIGTIFEEHTPLNHNDSLSEKCNLFLNRIRNAGAEPFNENLYDLLESCRKYSYNSAIYALSKLAFSILQLSENASGRSASQLNYIAIHNELSNIYNYSQLVAYFEKIYNDYTSVMKDAESIQMRNLIDQALSYLAENYANPELSIHIMAEHLYISTGHFSRIFNEVTGCTFPDYLTHLRMKHAKELLKSENINISDIAASVGYNSASYFSSSFRKEYGISPSKYRLQVLHQSETVNSNIL